MPSRPDLGSAQSLLLLPPCKSYFPYTTHIQCFGNKQAESRCDSTFARYTRHPPISCLISVRASLSAVYYNNDRITLDGDVWRIPSQSHRVVCKVYSISHLGPTSHSETTSSQPIRS